MEITIVEEKQNPFFKRKDLKLSLAHLNEPTPAKSSVAKELALKYGVDESQVQINYIFSRKGGGESLVSVKILDEKPQVTIQVQKEVSGNPEAQEIKPA